jgi:hypothetical protein
MTACDSSNNQCFGGIYCDMHLGSVRSYYSHAVISQKKICFIVTDVNKVQKCIANAPWYVRNSDLHRDLGIETVTIAKFAKSHEKRLQDNINIEASRLLNVKNITRRLKRKKPFELVIR